VFANTYFTPVTCFLLFNCGDYTGRILASWVRLPGRGATGQTITLLLSCLRAGFVPLFMLCNAAPGPLRNLPVIFSSDADYYVLMIVFSISNGYLGNLIMMLGPQTSSVREEQERIASLLVAVLVLGIGAGSFLSYPIVNTL
jgi:equilibrative nucleoside transporter 1/2/3